MPFESAHIGFAERMGVPFESAHIGFAERMGVPFESAHIGFAERILVDCVVALTATSSRSSNRALPV